MSDMQSDEELRELFGKLLPHHQMSPSDARALTRKVLHEARKLKRSTPLAKGSPLPFIKVNAVPTSHPTRNVIA